MNNFTKLIILVILGVGVPSAATVLMTFGLIQFYIINIFGENKATEIFGICSGVVSLVIIVMMPFGGYLIDKTNALIGSRRIWILLGSIASFICMYLITKTSNIIELTVVWVIVKFFDGMIVITTLSIIRNKIEQIDFGKFSGFIGAATPISIMILGLIIMGFFSGISVNDKIMLLAFFQLISCIVVMFIVNGEFDVSSTKSIYEKTKISNSFKYPSIKLYPDYTWALLTKFFISSASAGLSMTSLFLIYRFHLNEKEVFKLQAIMTFGLIFMVVGGIVFGYISDKLNKQKPLILIAAGIVSSCMLVYAFSNDIKVVIIAGLVVNFGIGAYNAIDTALIYRVLPSVNTYAKDIAIMNVASQISVAIINFLAPIIILVGQHLMGDDGYTLFFLLLCLLSLLSGVIVTPISEIKS